MSDTINIDEKISWRIKLIQSAHFARNEGYSSEIWKNDLQIKEVAIKSGLGLAVLDHIIAWVWTFKR